MVQGNLHANCVDLCLLYGHSGHSRRGHHDSFEGWPLAGVFPETSYHCPSRLPDVTFTVQTLPLLLDVGIKGLGLDGRLKGPVLTSVRQGWF